MLIKYLGSKRLLIPQILSVVSELPEVESVIDLFSGTSRVGRACKAQGYRVISNDLNTYAKVLADCYVVADREEWLTEAQELVTHLNEVKPVRGYFTETFCEASRFIQPHNGEKVDGIREEIERLSLPPLLKSIALTSLMEAADRVDSTTGLQMAYLKSWAKRSYKNLELRVPELTSASQYGSCEAHCMDALQAAKVLKADLAYLDPPYNQHKYLGNYHIWETLVRWDKPSHYGVACKREDVRERKSAFNSRVRIREGMASLLRDLQARYLLVSFNNEGYISRDEMVELLSKRGEVQVVEREYARYVGAKIGIHGPSGNRVGKVSHTKNKEFLFLVTPEGAPSLSLV